MVWLARHILETFGLAGAGLIFLLEGLGAPLPIEVPLWIIGVRLSGGHSSYWNMVMMMWLTTVVGNCAGYFLGYYGGRPAIMKVLQWFRVKPEKWEMAEGWFRKHGLAMVVATRWINWGFVQNVWLCGITRVRFWRFMAVMAINDLLWAMAWCWAARGAMLFYHRHGARFLHLSTMRLGLVALGVGLIGVAIWLWVRRSKPVPVK